MSYTCLKCRADDSDLTSYINVTFSIRVLSSHHGSVGKQEANLAVYTNINSRSEIRFNSNC